MPPPAEKPKPMLSTIEYAPIWIIMVASLALGYRTMIAGAWRPPSVRRLERMTHAQGCRPDDRSGFYRSGELTDAGSTTHVLSSSVAGRCWYGGGLQKKTVTSILMACAILPAAIILQASFTALLKLI